MRGSLRDLSEAKANERITMKGEMYLLNHSGHSVIEWDTEVPATVVDAERIFDELTDGGAFMVGTVGVTHEHMRHFEAQMPRITATPAFVGG